MKTKNSSSAPRDSTQGLIRYCNYYLMFPDGEVWSDYTHIAGGFHSWVVRTSLFRSNPEAASKLLKKGDHHWKDKNGVTHRMVISDAPCERKWGINQKVKRIAGKDS